MTRPGVDTRTAHDDTTRQAVHVTICEAAALGWHVYAAQEGVTLTALLDAVGHELAALVGLPPERVAAAAPAFVHALTEAGHIDSDRRARKR